VITGQAMAAGTLALAPLALALWGYAFQRSTPSRVAVFLALNPITAIALGVLLLGEPVTGRLVVALVAVLAGIQLATRGPRGR
jgi:drug/metabolite transporter (DMT)-like permease